MVTQERFLKYLGLLVSQSPKTQEKWADVKKSLGFEFDSLDHAIRACEDQLDKAGSDQEKSQTLDTLNPLLEAQIKNVSSAIVTETRETLYQAMIMALLEESVKDGLTGVLIYDKIANTAVEREYHRAERHKSPLSVIYLDGDKFKSVNDTYGHEAGDVIIKHLAKICSDSVRDIDIVSRKGGEEFVLILPETDEEGAYVVAERIRKKIEETPVIYDSQDISITASMGVGQLREGETMPALLKRVDATMYHAKELGRNQTFRSSEFRKYLNSLSETTDEKTGLVTQPAVAHA